MATRDQRFARKVIKRDRCCQECECTENLQAHHIISISEGGPDNPSNGITLCASCHADRHPDVPRNLFLNRAMGIFPPAPWNATSLAAELGCCERTVIRTAKALGIPRIGAQWAFYEDDKEKIENQLKHKDSRRGKEMNMDDLPDPITIPVLTRVLGYRDTTILERAIKDGSLKATKAGKIYVIYLADVHKAIESGAIINDG